MKPILCRSVVTLFAVCAQFLSFGQTPVLLKDINTTTTGIASSPSKGVWMGTNYYFTATNGINGIELWKSNGTAAGTAMLKDINIGNASSTPTSLTVVGSTLFFAANDGINGTELWKSDGSAAGTVLVKDIRSGINGSGASALVQMGSLLVFNADDGSTGVELWKSDGTTAGTVLIKEINVGPLGGGINRVTTTGTKVYFGGSDPTPGNFEVYKTDGTAAGTGLVKDINSTTGGVGGAFFTWGETLYFGGDGGSGSELWKSDGTAAGTVMVKEIYAGTTSGLPNAGNPSNFCIMGGKLYFSASDANGTELWVTDGTAAGTVMVKDINTTAGASSSPSRLTAIGSTIYFRASDGTANAAELWKSDGTAAGTVLVKDINPGTGTSSIDQLAVIGSALYFQANDGTNGAELWKSDGTAGGTTMVKDINATAATGSLPTNIVSNGTYLLFSADNGINGTELWKSDGTAAGTAMLININPDNGNSAIANLTAIGSRVVFSANDGTTGNEIWATNGTAAGTLQLADINTSTAGASSNPIRMTPFGGNLYFSATAGTATGFTGNELYKTDGTPGGTVLVKDINAGTLNSNPRSFTAQGGALYFCATEAATGAELWKTDGTATGTVLVKDIVSGTGSSTPGGSSSNSVDMFSTGSMLYFVALNQVSGQETGWDLYSSTGAIGSGGLLKDINPAFSANGNPNNFVSLGVGNTVYFVADDGTIGPELWKSDGTTAGTVLLKEITPGSTGTVFSKMLVLGGKFYFSAYSPTAGEELWQSDGTVAGTIVLKDINSGIASSSPQSLTLCGSYIYFSADNGTAGRELWRTDGTAAGTIMVTDIVAGSGGSNPGNFFYHPTLQSVFFSAYTPANGVELWEYDGTNTRLYTEVVTGAGSSNPGPIMLAGNNLVFVATNGSNGLELYGVETYNEWRGTTNSTWSTAGNWKKSLVPGTAESAYLPTSNVITEAALDVNATVVRLEIEANRTLTLNASRTLTVTDIVFNRGTIKGTGTLANASFTNAGTIAPGNSPGILSLTGNFTNQGTLQIELGGTTVGTGYDRFAVSGTASLGGTLTITRLAGFTMAAGQTFTILTASTVSGTFATVNWPSGITGNVSYTANSVVLNITAAVPLRLLSFTGKASGNETILNWNTENEQNTARFEVERSADGRTFVSIGSVTAAGSGAHTYSMADQKPFNGYNYYRLKMIDLDGRYTYSDVVKIKFGGNSGLQITPVPAVDFITAKVNNISLAGTHARIYNAAGAVIADIILDSTTKVDISTWAKGTYTLKTADESYRFIKQ